MKPIEMAEGKLARGPLPAMFCARHYEQVKAFHQSLADYAPTPLINLEALAKQLGIRAILVKDESQRFGLKAFKALGLFFILIYLNFEQLFCRHNQAIEFGYFIKQIRNSRADNEGNGKQHKRFKRIKGVNFIKRICKIIEHNLVNKETAEA